MLWNTSPDSSVGKFNSSSLLEECQGFVIILHLSHSSFLFSYLLSSISLSLNLVAWNIICFADFCISQKFKKDFAGLVLVIYRLCLEVSLGKSKGSLGKLHLPCYGRQPGCQLFCQYITMTSFSLESDDFFPHCPSSLHQQAPQSPSSFCLLPGPEPRLYILVFCLFLFFNVTDFQVLNLVPFIYAHVTVYHET